MVWTCRAQHRPDCRSTRAECGSTEKIWQAKEIMGWSAWEWQKEARYGFCWPSESFRVEKTPSRKTCQKAQPSVEENRALKWMWWWWWWWYDDFNRNHGLHRQRFSYYIKFFYQRNNSKVCFLPDTSTGTTVFIGDLFSFYIKFFYQRNNSKVLFYCWTFQPEPQFSSVTFFNSLFNLNTHNERIKNSFRVLTFAKPKCDNVLQAKPRSSEGCKTLHESLVKC